MVTRIGTQRPETLRGTGGDDILDGRGGNDRLFGLGGDDRLAGGEGVNRIDGGSGFDLVGFNYLEDEGLEGPLDSPVAVDLAAGRYAVGGVVTRVDGVEGAYGGFGDDTLAGDNGANLLLGSDGSDMIFGRGGDDRLFGGDDEDIVSSGGGNDELEGEEMRGGAGRDTLYFNTDGEEGSGGTGADRFVIESARGDDVLEPQFTIRDFDTRGGDVIELYAVSFGQTYSFIGERPLTDNNGIYEVSFEQRGGDTLVRYEVEAVAGEETVNTFRLAGEVDLTAGDFVL